MKIYKYNEKCYHCKQMVTYYTYLVFREYEVDVTFPLDMDMVRRVYAEMPAHREKPYFDDESMELNYPIKVLGDDAELDKIVMDSGKVPGIGLETSRYVHRQYAANHCSNPQCGAFLGNYHLREHITLNFLRPKKDMEEFVEI